MSPTFVLCQPYSGRRSLYHLDAYRVRDDDEFLQLGPEEYFESDGLTLIEWADRVIRCLPAQRVEIHIEVAGPTAREFRVLAVGPRYEPVLEALARQLGPATGAAVRGASGVKPQAAVARTSWGTNSQRSAGLPSTARFAYKTVVPAASAPCIRRKKPFTGGYTSVPLAWQAATT